MDLTRHTRATYVAAVLAACLLPAAVVTGCNDGGPASDGSRPGAGNGIDLGFLEGMVPHHKSAVAMAQIARRRAGSAFVEKLADDIIRTQSAEIATMTTIAAKLKAAGVEPKSLGLAEHQMGMNGDLAQLRTADPFDRAFIDMMVPHHQGAIRMARVELAKGSDGDARKLARRIIAAQSREIRAMNEHRSEAFGAPSPAGGVPAAEEGRDSASGDGTMSMDHG